MKLWIIPTEVNANCRSKINSAIPQFANFDAKLTPYEIETGIAIVTAWDDPADNHLLPAIENGVRRFEKYRQKQSQPVRRTVLVMSRMITHPIDTTELRVDCNVFNTLVQRFERHSVEVDI